MLGVLSKTVKISEKGDIAMKSKTTGGIMQYKIICLLGLALAGLPFAGCSAPKGKPFQAVQLIPAGKGVLYVYNIPSQHNNSEVLINDNAVGCLRGIDYMAFLCQPGPLTVSCGWKTELNSTTVNIESGSQSFVGVESHVVYSSLGVATFNIYSKLVPEQEALGQIQKMYLIKSNHGLAGKYSGNITPGTDLSSFKKVYVDIGKNDWQTSPYIVSFLTTRGYTVTSGMADAMPADTECMVKLKEGWFWDLQTYLLDLKVEFLNPKTKAVYASAYVWRAVPQGRRGPKVIATEAMNAIFNNGMPAGVEAVPEN
jgi:hypothetical protein